MKTPLYNSLRDYGNKVQYRMHMPGHKSLEELYKTTGFHKEMLNLDLTEIEGVDSLFHPRSSLLEAQEIAANLYGAKESIFLVNGASIGIMASIMAVVGEGEELIIPRNAHRSVFNALLLAGVKPIYIMPEIDFDTGVAMGINPLEIERALTENPKAKGVLIAHPNFYGFCSDIEAIAKIVHKYDKVLIVDEACGSHFKFHKELPISGIEVGADLIVHGTHKNLPALTQSGILHIYSNRVDEKKLKHYLMMLQSSSPSYILLASLEIALKIVEEKGIDLFNSLFENISLLKESFKKIKGVKCLDNNLIGKYSIAGYDFSKVVINFQQLNLRGYEVEAILRDRYGIQCELSDPANILITFTIADSREVFSKVLAAIEEIATEAEIINDKGCLTEGPWHLPQLVYTPKEAENKGWQEIDISHAKGRVSAETLSSFPPGMPIIRAGERVDERVLELLKAYRDVKNIKVIIE
ncbi:aminotransferase class I/II-fold pyridoxal phosphate-dependent enzyme [Alkaliphilus serpentinus]|uniref:Aminotransferase class V-fold PLP-dependent enzyme n=1 Tax=Alkaliphilus serpentinus TaxID=1482731 RepID=A0A833MDT0_9FIRM|nr:aminotransferase class V-fold PLP-dependent enzyme [Alkaliphilus serpentinus]KAB3529420.1 aminotransferase class V-fold PLP-dependent enzyme [Alkaliphilus serpentinus]